MARLVKATAFAYGIFVGGNWLSNFILHPQYKLDYGFINQLIGRPVKNKWWGTKTEHILTIAAPLAVTDVAITEILKKYLKVESLSWKGTPGPAIFHAVTFAISGIMLYVIWNAYMNPLIEPQNRTKFIVDHLAPVTAGSSTMCHVPKSFEICKPIMTGPLGFFGSWIPVAIAFAAVKGCGTLDYGARSLTPHEREMNGL